MLDIMLAALVFVWCFWVSRSLASIVFVCVITLYYLLVAMGYFHTYKFSGEFLPFFPDEMTYIEGRVPLPFSIFVSSIFPYVGESFFRLANLLSYCITWMVCFRFLSNNKHISFLDVIAIGCAAIGSYWCFFILKEALSLFSLLLGCIFFSVRFYLLAGFCFVFLFLARPDLLVLLSFAAVVWLVFKRSKLAFFCVATFIMIVVGWFMSTPYAYPLKLSFMARRFGESARSYDSEAMAAAAMPVWQFLVSEPYIQTVLANLFRAFNPLYEGVSLFALLTVVNLVSLLLLIHRVFWKRWFEFIDFFFVLVAVLLALTHNVSRYQNLVSLFYIGYSVLNPTGRGSESISDESK